MRGILLFTGCLLFLPQLSMAAAGSYVCIQTIDSFGPDSEHFDKAQGVAVASNGDWYASAGDGRMHKFDRQNNLLVSFDFGQSIFNSVTCLAVNDQNNNVFTVYPAQARVEVFDRDGHHVSGWGSQGSEPGQFDNPCSIATHLQLVAVGDNANRRIQVFDQSGQLIRVIPTDFNHAPSASNIPSAIAFNQHGDLYVGDLDGWIQSFNTSDPDPSQWHRISAWRAANTGIYGLAVDPQGQLYAAVRYEHRVLKLSQTGVVLAAIGQDQIEQPFGVSVSSNGLVYVSDRDRSQVKVFEVSNGLSRKPVKADASARTHSLSWGGLKASYR